MRECRFEKEIAAFEEEDRRSPPQSGVILFAGSSSITRWNRRLSTDMAPLRVVGRGFGGSTMADLLGVWERIIPPWQPNAVVVYEGDNDLAGGRLVEEVREDFEHFFTALFSWRPGLRVYVLAVKFSPIRRSLWPLMRSLNAVLEARCRFDSRLMFIDTAASLMDHAGEPRLEFYAADGLHLSEAGYAAWREVIRPVLMRWELQETVNP